MAVQLQEDLSNLWEEYKKKPISFAKFNKMWQIELEELLDTKISRKDTYFKRHEDYPQKHKYKQKTHDLKGTTATNDAKLMEWKSSDNTRAEVIVTELKGKGLSLDWVGNNFFIIDTG